MDTLMLISEAGVYEDHSVKNYAFNVNNTQNKMHSEYVFIGSDDGKIYMLGQEWQYWVLVQ